ncbi:MAG: hypothetical protein JXR96_18825 [Deltaproteobacteria bacterium]|nr:hypothetical protein [Deltaproteobacteria bacterium]
MNYLTYVHAKLFFFVKMGAVLAICAGAFFCLNKLVKLLGVPEKRSGFVLAPVMLLVVIGTYLGVGELSERFDRGAIREVFAFRTAGGSERLAVWMTRVHSKRVGADYEQRLYTYELASARPVGMLELSGRRSSDDQVFYWSGGDKAWSYGAQTGLVRIDLARPGIVARAAEIRKKTTAMKGRLRPYSRGDCFDARTGALYIEDDGGELFELSPELEARPVDRPSVSSRGHESRWRFQRAPHSLGRCLLVRKGPCPADSATLLEPKIVAELGAADPERIWVAHDSGLFERPERLISYLDADGRQLGRINLVSLLEDEDIEALAVYSREKDVLIFAGAGKSRLVTRARGFSLFGLSVDRESGELTGKKKYF